MVSPVRNPAERRDLGRDLGGEVRGRVVEPLRELREEPLPEEARLHVVRERRDHVDHLGPVPPEAMPRRANEYCSAPLTSGDEGGSDVTSVTVVVRHGARSGIATEVQDWKCGLGALKSHVKRWEAASGNELTP